MFFVRLSEISDWATCQRAVYAFRFTRVCVITLGTAYTLFLFYYIRDWTVVLSLWLGYGAYGGPPLIAAAGHGTGGIKG